ncbi:MAG: hypothetical protein NTY36_07165 [Deltaproteobacteria bacterium]|nr:hypothetical protein [Deltaproteobacteria bacterium]
MKKQVVVGLLLSLVAVFFLAVPSEAVKFRYEDLGTLGGNQDYSSGGFRQIGINDLGQVVGMSHTAGGDSHAFLKSPGKAMQELPLLSGTIESQAYCINHSGLIGGYYNLYDGTDDHACKWQLMPGPIYQVIDLGVGGGSEAYGLNDAGYFVGVARNSGYQHAHVLPPVGNAQDLGTLPGHHGSIAKGINSSGTIVGYSFDSSYINTACYWSPSGGSWAAAVSLFGVANSVAISINSQGQAVGYVISSGDSHAVLQSLGQPLQYLGSFVSPQGSGQAYDINDSGWVVGWSSGYAGLRASLWTSNGGAQDLNKLTVNLPTGVILYYAMAINKRGEIAGYMATSGSDINGVFKLTPIPEPPLSLLLFD